MIAKVLLFWNLSFYSSSYYFSLFYYLYIAIDSLQRKCFDEFCATITEETLEKIACDDILERIPNIRSRKVTDESHDVLDSGKVQKSEFILLVLGLMNKLCDSDIMLAAGIFDR